jgi:sarcosine oxidase
MLVAWLGGMGSASVRHLAACVLGIERFTQVHNRGSSHGRSQVILQSYFEDMAYVLPLLWAYELWS